MPKNTDTAKAKDTARFKDKGNVQVYHSQATTNCPKCSENHGIFNCSDFNSLSMEDRVQFVKNNKLCFNCLRTGHSSKDCKSKSEDRICKKRHNTLLHRPLALKKDEVTPQSCLGCIQAQNYPAYRPAACKKFKHSQLGNSLSPDEIFRRRVNTTCTQSLTVPSVDSDEIVDKHKLNKVLCKLDKKLVCKFNIT